MAALLLILLAMVLLAAQLTVGLVRSPHHFRVSPADSARSLHWTVTLCHPADPTHVDLLLRSTLARSKTGAIAVNAAFVRHLAVRVLTHGTLPPARDR